LSEPSKFVRVTRGIEYALKKEHRRTIPGKAVTASYAKKHKKTTTQSIVYVRIKTTRSGGKGEKVTRQYAKLHPRLVKKRTIYRTKPRTVIRRSESTVPLSYAKRYPRCVKKVQYIQIEERAVLFDPVLKKQTYGDWRVTSRERLSFYEKILNVKELTSRHVRLVLGQNRIFSNIWQNDKGVIRVTVNGHVEGRHVKNVAHIGYLKSLWAHKHEGYSQFKDYVVNKILQSLRRSHLRLSNAEESRMRLVDLHARLKDAYERLDSSPSWNKESIQEGIQEIKKLIRQQKKARQLTGGTIRIEKLVPH